MILATDKPHFRATCRDSSCWVLPLEELTSFLAAYFAGKPFWTGTNAYGERVHIKLADITGVIEKTAESIAHHADEAAEERSRNAITGG